MKRFIEECLFAILTAAVLVSIMWQCERANAYELNIYDSRAVPGETVIEVLNDCGYTHRLVVPLEQYKQQHQFISNWILTVMDLCETVNNEDTKTTLHRALDPVDDPNLGKGL